MPMAGEEAVVTFGGIAIQVIDNVPICCRGRYNVELHLSFLRLHGQFEDSVVDLLLPLSEGLLNMKYRECLLTSYKVITRATEGVPALPDDDDDAVDPHLERIKNEAGGDDSDEEKSAKKKPKKEATVSKPCTSRKKADGDASKKKKQKKKRDPNPPKKAISAFMHFLQSERENVKKSNSGIAFYEVGRILGERWNKLSAEEKKLFEAMAKADKKRYSEQISNYRNLQPTAMDSGSESGCF
ncbi:hypothetical protein R3W88_006995 [Solanum pinnatisectum]|uniref:HMG box domain-containing protein n=1 Tax=Solanum pinnatisectum TaxID=50273 RepID=A0AAV9KKB1_9SOLN|nr:hypothetical protein R3W88_006995 [Solanum pinnatisectum]